MSTTMSRKAIGPVELLVVKFPGSQFKGEIAPALANLVESGTIRVIDILFAHIDEDGGLSVAEIGDLDDELYATFDPLVEELTGLLTEVDIRQLSGTPEPNTSVVLMLFENTWAIKFRDAVLDAKGELVFNERIPRAVIDELVAEREQLSV